MTSGMHGSIATRVALSREEALGASDPAGKKGAGVSARTASRSPAKGAVSRAAIADKVRATSSCVVRSEGRLQERRKRIMRLSRRIRLVLTWRLLSAFCQNSRAGNRSHGVEGEEEAEGLSSSGGESSEMHYFSHFFTLLVGHLKDAAMTFNYLSMLSAHSLRAFSLLTHATNNGYIITSVHPNRKQ